MKHQCNNCGKTYEARRKTSKFCSPSCRVQHYRKRGLKGAETPTVKPTIVIEPKPTKRETNPVYDANLKLYTESINRLNELNEFRNQTIKKHQYTLEKDYGLDKALITGVLGGFLGYKFAEQYKQDKFQMTAIGFTVLSLVGYVWGHYEGKDHIKIALEGLIQELSDIDNGIILLENQIENQKQLLESTQKYLLLPEPEKEQKPLSMPIITPEPFRIPKPEPLFKASVPIETRIEQEPTESERETTVSIVPARELTKKQFQVISFKFPYKNLIGEPPFGFHAIIYGLPGQGKSTFAIQFANYLASNHGKTLYISAEEGHEKTLVDKLKRQLTLSDMLDIADVPDSNSLIDLIPQTHYPFVFIDSADRLGLTAKTIQDIRKISKSALIVIHQSTKSGEMKGAQELQHDADVVITVDQYHASTENQKNRYGVHGTIKINPLSTY